MFTTNVDRNILTRFLENNMLTTINGKVFAGLNKLMEL